MKRFFSTVFAVFVLSTALASAMTPLFLNPKAENGMISIKKSDLSKDAAFVNYKAGGITVQLIAVIADDGNYRLTYPSNFWDDISVPFWSMPENTDHPTQKPEKLYAKLILASTKPGDIVFDPFLGSGTASVVAKKLGRHYLGIEMNEEYCLLAQKRLNMADEDKSIQGYSDGVFWERNTAQLQKKQD